MNDTSNKSFYSTSFGWVDPVRKDKVGILAAAPDYQAGMVLVAKNSYEAGAQDYANNASSLESAILNTSLQANGNGVFNGFVQVEDKDVVMVEPDVPGKTIFCTGEQPQSRVHVGNWPLIRAKSDVNARKGYGMKKNKIAIFCNTTGDIMAHTTNKNQDTGDEDNDNDDNDPAEQNPEVPENPAEQPPAQMENPLEIQNPNPQQPALKVCQDSTEPTTMQLCNDNPETPTQIQFGHPQTTDPSIPTELTPSPPLIMQLPDGTLELIPAGPAGIPVPVPPAVVPPIVPAIVIPPVPAIVGPIPAVIVPPPIVIPPGIVAPLITLSPVVPATGLPAPGGALVEALPSVTPGGVPTVTIGGLPIVTFAPGVVGGGAGGGVLTTTGGTGGQEVVTTTGGGPQEVLTGTTVTEGQPTIGTPNPTQPVHIITTEVIIGDPVTGPGSLTFVGPCTKTMTQQYDCTTGTLIFSVTEGAVTTNIMTISETSVTYPTTTIIQAPSFTLEATAANPAPIGDAARTIWLPTADVTHPNFGSETIAFISDLVSSGLADTNPINNSLVVYDGITGSRKSPDVTVTSDQSLVISKSTSTDNTDLVLKRVSADTCGLSSQVLPSGNALISFNGSWDESTGISRLKAGNSVYSFIHEVASDIFKLFRVPASDIIYEVMTIGTDNKLTTSTGIKVVPVDDSNGWLTVGPDPATNTLGTVVIQSLTGANQGYSAINFNGYFNSSDTRINTGKKRWRLAVDHRSSTDSFSIDSYDGTTNTSVLSITGSTITGASFASTRYDMTSAAANPGSTGTIWADSTTSSSLRYGTGNVLVDPAPTVANAIPVYTGVGGQVDTASSTSAATLSRALSISLPNNTPTGLSVYGLSASRIVHSFINGNGSGVHSSSVQIGGNGGSQRWSFATDAALSGGDDMFIRRDDTVPVYAITATAAGLVTTPNGIVSKRIDLTSSAANPGSTNTLWYDSATSRAKVGSSTLMVSTDIPAISEHVVSIVAIQAPTPVMPTVTFSFVKIGKFVTMAWHGFFNNDTPQTSDYFRFFVTYPSSMAPDGLNISTQCTVKSGGNYDALGWVHGIVLNTLNTTMDFKIFSGQIGGAFNPTGEAGFCAGSLTWVALT